MKLVDSTVVIDYLRDRDAAATLVESELGDEGLGASEIVRFEVMSGARDDEVESIERLFDAISWVPIDEPIARLGGLLARRFRLSQAGIGIADYLIAATALALDAELLTTNVRHFPMLEGLRPAY